jgi:transposase-like protein
LANSTKRTPEKEQSILDALEEHGNYSRAARSARIGRRTLYQWRDADPEFNAKCISSRELGLQAELDDLETKLIERGKKISDTAAIFMLKSHRPGRYREKVEHTGEDGGPLKIVIERVTREVSE